MLRVTVRNSLSIILIRESTSRVVSINLSGFSLVQYEALQIFVHRSRNLDNVVCVSRVASLVPLLDDVNNGGANGNLISGGGNGGGNGGGGGNYGGGQAVTVGGGTFGGNNQYESGRLGSQGGRGSNHLQGLSGGSLYSSGSSGSQGDYGRVQSAAYNTMLGASSYTSGGLQQQQLPYGTLLSSSYAPSSQSQYQGPSSNTQGYAQQSYQQPQPQFQPAAGYSSQYSSSQQRSPYSSGVIPQIGPSYRSLSNRLLRLQADASDIVTTKTVNESTPSSVLRSFEQSG